MSTNNVKKTKTSEIIRIDPFKIKKETNRKKQKQKGDGLEQTVVSRLPSYRDTLTFVHLIKTIFLAIKMIIVNKIEIVTMQDKFLFVNAKICIIEGTCISYKINSIESSRVSGLYFDKSQKDIFLDFPYRLIKKNLDIIVLNLKSKIVRFKS